MPNIVIHHQQIPSTQDLARQEKARLRPGIWWIDTADEQTKGRGTHNRNWASPPDVNVYVTYSFLMPVNKHNDAVIPHLSQVAALAVTQMLQSYGLHPTLKWVNDVLLNQRKMCGILVEVENVTVAGIDYYAVFLGMGINVNMSLAVCEQLDQPVTSMSVIAGKTFDKNEVLAKTTGYLQTFIQLLLIQDYKVLRPHINAVLERYDGEEIIFDTAGMGKPATKEQLIKGRILGMNEQGHLQLATQQGIKSLLSGRILKGTEKDAAIAIMHAGHATSATATIVATPAWRISSAPAITPNPAAGLSCSYYAKL